MMQNPETLKMLADPQALMQKLESLKADGLPSIPIPMASDDGADKSPTIAAR